MVLRLELDGPVLELLRVGEDEYAAELDGKRISIRRRSQTHEVTSVGYGRTWADEWNEAMVMKMPELADLAGVEPDRRGDAWVFAFTWDGHYRQHTSVKTTIELRDGVVVIDTERYQQDESYY